MSRKAKRSRKKRPRAIRPLGVILAEMEPLMEEAIDDHELQWGEWLAAQLSWLQIHRPGAREVYVAGGNPIYYYGFDSKKEGE